MFFVTFTDCSSHATIRFKTPITKCRAPARSRYLTHLRRMLKHCCSLMSVGRSVAQRKLRKPLWLRQNVSDGRSRNYGRETLPRGRQITKRATALLLTNIPKVPPKIHTPTRIRAAFNGPPFINDFFHSHVSPSPLAPRKNTMMIDDSESDCCSQRISFRRAGGSRSPLLLLLLPPGPRATMPSGGIFMKRAVLPAPGRKRACRHSVRPAKCPGWRERVAQLRRIDRPTFHILPAIQLSWLLLSRIGSALQLRHRPAARSTAPGANWRRPE